MSVLTGLKEEARAVLLYTLCFGVWFSGFMLIKTLILAEYEIEFRGVSAAVVAALILAKVVLLLEHVSLGPWIERQAAWVDVAVRTVVYGAGVVVVLLLEKAFELRHDTEGVVEAVVAALHHEDVPHVLANALCVTGALLAFNTVSVVRRKCGEGFLWRLFTAPSGATPDRH